MSKLSEGIRKLSEAIDFAERIGPLPRCAHGQALRDGAGEALEPPCGCRAKPRMKDIDPDYRREPKTDRFCVRCQKDIKPDSIARSIHIVGGGFMALHPEDERLYADSSDDYGFHLLGMDCAMVIGMEWSTALK